VHRIARYRQYEKIEFDDLVQEGSIGLLMAITKFEPNSEFTFAAQATPWIMAMMSRFAGNNRCSIRQPLYKQQQIRNIRKSINSLRVKLRREPTAQQIAIHMQLDERHVKGLIEAMNTEQDILSTDGGISNDEDDDSRKLIDQIADESRRTESAAEASEHRKITKSLLKTLTARERKVLQLSFGLLKDRTEHTHEQIAHQLRITRQSSTRIEERALKKLRRECARRGYELRDYIDE
jgi:RNA polymerase primary sigma factor